MSNLSIVCIVEHHDDLSKLAGSANRVILVEDGLDTKLLPEDVVVLIGPPVISMITKRKDLGLRNSTTNRLLYQLPGLLWNGKVHWFCESALDYCQSVKKILSTVSNNHQLPTPEYRVVSGLSEFEQAVTEIEQWEGLIGFDVETTGLTGDKDFRVVGAAFSCADKSIYFELRGELQQVKDRFAEFLYSIESQLVVYNGAFEHRACLNEWGCKLLDYKDAICYFSLHGLPQVVSLKYAVRRQFPLTTSWDDDFKSDEQDWTKEQRQEAQRYRETGYDTQFGCIPTDILAPYCCLDAYYTLMLYKAMIAEFGETATRVFSDNMVLSQVIDSPRLDLRLTDKYIRSGKLLQQLSEIRQDYWASKLLYGLSNKVTINDIEHKGTLLKYCVDNFIDDLGTYCRQLNATNTYTIPDQALRIVVESHLRQAGQLSPRHRLMWAKVTEELRPIFDKYQLVLYNSVLMHRIEYCGSLYYQTDWSALEANLDTLYTYIYTENEIKYLLFEIVKKYLVEVLWFLWYSRGKQDVGVVGSFESFRADRDKIAVEYGRLIKKLKINSIKNCDAKLFCETVEFDVVNVKLLESWGVERFSELLGVAEDAYPGLYYIACLIQAAHANKMRRRYEKGVSTYAEGLGTNLRTNLKRVDGLRCVPCAYTPELTDAVSFKFQALEKITTRWSSNYHTLPSDSEIRKIYRPAYDGDRFVYFDVKGAEVAVVAAMSGDSQLINDYLNAPDLYMAIAMRSGGAGDANSRKQYKAALLSTMYGMGIKSLASLLKDTMKVAETLVASMKAAYPKMFAYLEHLSDYAVSTGCVDTYLKNKIRLIYGDSNTLPRHGRNYAIQGYTSQILASGFLNLVKTGRDFASITGTVHDSCQLSVSNELSDEQVSEWLGREFSGYLSKYLGFNLRYELKFANTLDFDKLPDTQTISNGTEADRLFWQDIPLISGSNCYRAYGV